MKFLFAFFVLISSQVVFAQDAIMVHADSLVEFAKKQLGVTYKYGTSNPGVSFDCSGFAHYVYKSFGLESSRSSRDYTSIGSQVDLSECKKGDCLVFTGSNSADRRAGHVGIVVENNEGQIKFIHSSSSKNHYGVVITSLNDTNYTKRLLQVRRLIDHK
jgi:cell wall-associated NlpC family hydrolase